MIATALAKHLYEAGVRLEDKDDTDALGKAPEALQRELLDLWLKDCDHDIEVTLNHASVRDALAEGRTLQAVYDEALFERFERAARRDIDIDVELWIMQNENRRDAHNDEVSALLRDQAA
jgi:hypothetical protein